MKMIYYDRYEYEDGKYIGNGELITEDIDEFLEGKHVGKRGNYKGSQILLLCGGRIDENNKRNHWTYKKDLYHFIQGFQENINSQKINPNSIGKISGMLGPLGKQNFIKKNGNYYCGSFTFEEDWFSEESRKLRKLRISFQELHGIKKIVSQPFSSKTKIDIIKVSNKDNDVLKKEFLDSLNDCMDNVRLLYVLDEKTDKLKTIHQPINIFGYAALKFLLFHQKKMNFYFCKMCDELNYMKRASSFICPNCQNKLKQRRKNIKDDFERGLSVEEVSQKRKSSSFEEIEKLYIEYKHKKRV